MICPRCGKDNEADARFCAKCGRNLEDAVREGQTAYSANEEAKHCYRHPKVETNLSCGRCGNPICTKCAVIGPAGPRCPDCSKSDVVFRPGAMGLGVKRTFRSLFSSGPWAWYALILIGSLLIGGLSTCSRLFSGPPQAAPIYEEDYTPPPQSEENE